MTATVVDMKADWAKVFAVRYPERFSFETWKPAASGELAMTENRPTAETGTRAELAPAGIGLDFPGGRIHDGG